MVTMSQKSSVLQPAKAVSQALTPDKSDCFRLLFIVLELSQASQFAKDPFDQLRNGILEQK